MTDLDDKIRNAFHKENLAQILLPSLSWISALLILLVHYKWAISSQTNIHFQRAGAAIICVDIIAFSLMTFISNTVLSIAVIGGRTPSKLAFLSAFSMAALAVVGTIIWGYGDIFFDKLSN